MNFKKTGLLLMLLLCIPFSAHAKTGRKVYINDKKIEKTSTINLGDAECSIELKGYPINTRINFSNPKVLKKEYNGSNGDYKSWQLIAKKYGNCKIFIKSGKKNIKTIRIKVKKPVIAVQRINDGVRVQLKNTGDNAGFVSGNITWIFKPSGVYGYKKRIIYKNDCNDEYLYTPGHYKVYARYKGKVYRLKKKIFIPYDKEDFEIKTLSDAKKVVPDYIINSLMAHGYKYEIAKTGGYVSIFSKTDPNVNGVHDAEKRIISVNDTSATVVIHEIGHFISCSYAKINGKNITETEKWKMLFSKEGPKYNDNRNFFLSGSSYASSSANEYFAECFQLYCLKPKQLKKCCPETYKMMHFIIQKDFPAIADQSW